MSDLGARDVLRAIVSRGERSSDSAEVQHAFAAAEILWTTGERAQGLCRDCGRSWTGVRCRCTAVARSAPTGDGRPIPPAAPGASWQNRLAAADSVELRLRSASPFRVAIPRVTRASIAWAAQLFTDPRIERGGGLIGKEDENGIALVDHTEDGDGDVGTFRHNFESAERRARELGHKVVGTFHTHDDGEGGAHPTPSDPADLRILASTLLVYGLDRTVGLVLTPDRDRGWDRPVFNAYVAHVEGARTIVEPAAIEEVD